MLNFEKTTLGKVSALVETIAFHTINDIEHIERYYLNKATDFSDNLSFLSAIQLVEVLDEKILPSAIITSLQSIQDKQEKSNKLKLVILDKILQNNDNTQIQEFWDYCSRFSLDGNRFSYIPNLTNRLKQAGIRNFLMELGFVKKDNDRDKYFIDGKHANLFTSFRENTTVLTPEAFASMQKRQVELGNRAEQRIIEYEMKKLKDYPYMARNIEHIAKINVNAGYDIESFCKDEAEKGVSKKIYIEVKAVSAIQKKFYWSANEVETAKRLKSRYYLYLLPIGLNEQFDIDNLQIIQNPYESVYLSSSWLKREESISVTEKI